MSFWEKFDVVGQRICHRQIGPLRLWAEKRGDEWLLAWSRAPEDKESLVEKTLERVDDPDLEWHRWVLPSKDRYMRLSPMMPDRPVVVKPESEIRISAGAEALFFVAIPVCLRIYAGHAEEALVCEVPTVVMSNTWFGPPHEGELCYSLRTSARRTLEGMPRRAHQAMCPVHISNTAAHDLEFTRLCIQMGHLSVYRGDAQMWTEKVHVQFRGVDQVSQIRYESSAPAFDNARQQIGQPRDKGTRHFARKSFDTFRFLGGE